MSEKSDVSDFQKRMLERFEAGRKKYGMKYLRRDNLSELQDELIDVANYAMMQWLKIESLKSLHLKEDADLEDRSRRG